jgi:two-component system, sensor histidine kinase LadS
MKYKFSIILFLIQLAVFSQTDIYFFKDSTHNFTIENIKKEKFQLLESQILEKYSNDYYWFKIPALKNNATDSKYIFRILYERINHADAFQNDVELKKLHNQRNLSYRFSRDDDVYIKVDPKLHTYIPVTLDSEQKSILKEKNQLLINGFYYGFALLIIVYNLFYYALFKDDAFLYYALFLTSMSFGIFTMDGMLNFYNVDEKINNFLMVLNYIFLAFFSSKFANSYLLLDRYYPKLERYSYVVGYVIIALGILYLVQLDYYYLLLLNILVFNLLFAYWLCTVLLFKKNFYVKILAVAYVIILFSGIDFFVLKFLGISFINADATTIKIGAFLEMIILSIAVLYRMNILKAENEYMRNEIVNYSKQINELTIPRKENNKSSIEELSLREREIFDLIILGKSNKEIAETLNISVNTVKFHVKNIYEKLQIKNRKEAYNLSVN